MSLSVSFLNKNLFRKYPLRSSSNYISNEGVEIPLSLLSHIKITTKLDTSDVFISKIYVSGNYINITIAHKVSSSVNTYLGYFSATVTQDYQTVTMTPVQTYCSGTLILGLKDVLSTIQGINNLSYDNGKIEDSLIICAVLPAITSLKNRDKILTGDVTFKLDNITRILNSPTITLDVTDLTLVKSPMDKNAARLNCLTNTTKSINGVTPDNNGNIDIYAILPAKVSLLTNGVSFSTPGVALPDICLNVHNNIPPILQIDQQIYVDFLTVTEEEWKNWPQYN